MPSANDFDKELKPRYSGEEALRAERAKSSLDVQRFSEFLLQRDYLERQARVLSVLENDPVFDKSANYFRSRLEMLTSSLARAKRVKQLSLSKKWSDEDSMMADYLIGEPKLLHVVPDI